MRGYKEEWDDNVSYIPHEHLRKTSSRKANKNSGFQYIKENPTQKGRCKFCNGFAMTGSDVCYSCV